MVEVDGGKFCLKPSKIWIFLNFRLQEDPKSKSGKISVVMTSNIPHFTNCSSLTRFEILSVLQLGWA